MLRTAEKSAVLELRAPSAADGARIWELVKDTGVLDLNSAYAYMMVARNFAGTSIVAEAEGEIAGAITGHVLPEKPDTLFIWQVATNANFRGMGVASTMLHGIVDAPACQGVRFMETTISPSNEASQALFRRFADDRAADVDVTTGFSEDMFPVDGHEPEDLYRIGAF